MTDQLRFLTFRIAKGRVSPFLHKSRIVTKYLKARRAKNILGGGGKENFE